MTRAFTPLKVSVLKISEIFRTRCVPRICQHRERLLVTPAIRYRRLLTGFTLVETIIVVGLTAFITTTLGFLLSYFYKTNAYALEQSVAVAQSRRGVEDAAKHLREASYGSDGSYPIEYAATSSVRFYADVVGDETVERVTYTRIDKTLYRAVTTPTGDPLSYAAGTTATTTVATAVTNGATTPIFRYFDDAGVELTTPVDQSKIASVKTTVVVDVNVNRAPVAFTLSSGATLRNLKPQL